MIKGREFVGQKVSKPMSEEARQRMINEASAYLVVKFKNGGNFSSWSKESQNKRILNINDAINEFMRLFQLPRWIGQVESAAIFDVRYTKKCSAENKIYQYDNGHWQLLQPVNWQTNGSRQAEAQPR